MRALGSILVLLMLLTLHDRSRGQIADAPQADAYPIIAELYSDPGRYAGRSVMIYGLVVESGPGSTFLLQDVSQHPLKIVGDERMRVAVGDQLLVFGLFHAEAGAPYLSAKALIAAQVVAGGGCC